MEKIVITAILVIINLAGLGYLIYMTGYYGSGFGRVPTMKRPPKPPKKSKFKNEYTRNHKFK